jgi:hypothetical protein
MIDRPGRGRGPSSSDCVSAVEGQSSPPVPELRETSSPQHVVAPSGPSASAPAFPSPARFEVTEDFKVLWLNTKNRTAEGNISKPEKVMNRLTDTASELYIFLILRSLIITQA